jgi:hypothetical protein
MFYASAAAKSFVFLMCTNELRGKKLQMLGSESG